RTLLSNGVGIDVSAGARELKLGTGMLIANGGASGFELGALKFGPRKAWDLAGIARITKGRTTFTGFYLSPNERPVIENDNRLAGADLRHDFENRAFLGTTFVKVTRSQTPWVQAAPGGIGPPTVIPGGRDDTNTIGLYGRTGNMDGALRNWLFALDLAYQWNDRLDQSAWAGRVQVGYTFSDAKWRPSITNSYQTISGDDPDTPELERYDPLFYEGSPSAWATGSKSSMVFINSNVRSHGVAGRIQPSPKDTITLRYNHIRANELRSPLQFGQASRVDLTPGGDPANIVAGVTDAHVSDDLFIEYSRIISRNLFLTAGLSVSDPGEGIENVVPGGVPEWTGGFVNLVFNF
ncbi:MAG: alginate export family protein, partial [Parvibaculum sp.]